VAEAWGELEQASRVIGESAGRRLGDPRLAERIELGLAEVGVRYARAAPPEMVRHVTRVALAALDRWQAAQRAVPAVGRDWRALVQVAEWRAELERLRAGG
jgi:hypothetical protein